jgi:lipoprotein-anchoring transpeptidase ErfK/SrfK
MLFRTAFATMTVLISLVGQGGKSLAQSHRGYPTQPNLPVPPIEGEDVVGPGGDRPGSEGLGQFDSRLTGSTRRDSSQGTLPPEIRPEIGPAKELPSQFRRTLVDYYTKEPTGTIIVDTPNTYLYFVLGNGKALRYGIGVGREGFTWSGSEKVSRMAEWPDWNPPEQMIERQPYLPRFMAGGEGNPLGARALYLGDTLFRIHGTNQPSTIGTFVSSGCIRLTNEDIIDLHKRVKIGTRVVVLSAGADGNAATRMIGSRRVPPVISSGANSQLEAPKQKRRMEATTAKSQQGDVSVLPQQNSAAGPHQMEPSEKRPDHGRPELGTPNREKEAARGVPNEASGNQTWPVQKRPSPTKVEQEATAFEE